MADDPLSAKKQLLIAQAELQRIKLGLAWHDMRQSIWPAIIPPLKSAARGTAGHVLGFALPVFGMARAGRIVRLLSIAVSAYRLLRGFARPHR